MAATLTTQVGIVGAGPAGLLLSHLLHLAGIDSVVAREPRPRLRRAPRARRRPRARQRRPAGRGRRGRAAAARGPRASRHRVALRRPRPPHRLPDRSPAAARSVVYGQQEVVKDLIQARLAGRRNDPVQCDEVALARHRRPLRRRFASRTMATTTRFACSISSPAATASTAYAGNRCPPGVLSLFERAYPFAWLGILAKAPPTHDGADLRVSRPRLRALQHALAGDHAPVPAGRAGRGHRALARRPDLGRNCTRGSRPATAGN